MLVKVEMLLDEVLQVVAMYVLPLPSGVLNFLTTTDLLQCFVYLVSVRCCAFVSCVIGHRKKIE